MEHQSERTSSREPTKVTTRHASRRKEEPQEYHEAQCGCPIVFAVLTIHLFPFCRHQVRIQGETSAYSFHKWRRWYRSIGLFFHHNSESPVLLCWVYGREEGRRELKNMIRAHCHPGAYPSYRSIKKETNTHATIRYPKYPLSSCEYRTVSRI